MRSDDYEKHTGDGAFIRSSAFYDLQVVMNVPIIIVLLLGDDLLLRLIDVSSERTGAGAGAGAGQVQWSDWIGERASVMTYGLRVFYVDNESSFFNCGSIFFYTLV